MNRFERLLLWVPLVSLLAAPLAWGAEDPGSSAPPSAADATQVRDSAASPGVEPVEKKRSSRPNGQVDLSSASDHDEWVKRIRDAYRAVDDAQQQQDQAVIGYGKARHKNKTRGDAKREILEDRQQARGEIAEAQSNLEKVLEEARRAGVPPGWLREAKAGKGPANRD